MTRGFFPRPTTAAIAAVLLSLGSHAASAQSSAPHRHRAARAVAAETTPTTYRGLTVNRAPTEGFADRGDEQDIYRDGPIRYNDIRDYSPAPYVTSGVQFPYGFDGVGGYGSDLGFSAGQDTANYDRGAGSYP